MQELEALKAALKTVLETRFGIAHSTLEMESDRADCKDVRGVDTTHGAVKGSGK
jgi:hypothetical protein